MTVSTNPESSTISYAYDADGNVITKTDARSIVSTYSYDKINRGTGITYSNSDPSVAYAYDQSTCIGQTPCYNVGRRTSMTDAGGSETLSYDKMGREWGEQRVSNSVTKTTTYTYDLDGNLATLAYPSGRTITYSYNGVAQPISAVDIANSITYASNGLYAPQGGLAQAKLGSNLSRSRISIMIACNLAGCMRRTGAALPTTDACNTADPGPGNILDLQYGFNLATDNGNVATIANNRDTTRTQTFTYDQVNRIVSGQTGATTGADCWGETFAYDQRRIQYWRALLVHRLHPG